jgi:hypothetical protein
MKIARSSAVICLAAVAGFSDARETGSTVFLNHFFVVVDAETAAAVQTSEFLTGEFAPFEKRTTERNDTSYTGVYWYGQRTYFELFEPGVQGPAGASGLALGVEEPGASASVRQAWKDALGTAGGGLVTRKIEKDEVPWFEMTYANEIPGLRVWLMEYHGDFLARFFPALTKARSIARKDVLDRYVAKIGKADERESALMGDVTGLTVSLSPESRDALLKQFRAVGWTTRPGGTTVVCAGPESVELRLVEAGDRPAGITEVGFSLRRSATAATHRLGTAELRLEGKAARLRLR